MKHWETANPPQMMLEKLHKLMLAQVDDEQKVKWLKIRNFGDPCKREEGFPLETINDKELDGFFPHIYLLVADDVHIPFLFFCFSLSNNHCLQTSFWVLYTSSHATRELEDMKRDYP